MSDDLDDLRARVAAARDRLTHDVDFAQKVELRLNDLARIVEGSLARQSAELDGAKTRILLLEDDLGRAVARAEQATGEASRAERLAKENGELKTMVMALLEVIEGRQKSSLTSVMQKLEENVSALVAAPEMDAAPAVPGPQSEDLAPEPEPESAPEPEPASEEVTEIEIDTAPPSDAAAELAEPEMDDVAFDIEPAEADIEATPTEQTAAEAAPGEPAAESNPLEDLSEIALYDAADEVVEPSRP